MSCSTSTDNTFNSYHPVSKFLHWLMALIWISAWCIGFIAAHMRDELNFDFQLTFLHKSLASTVIFLTALRVVWRLTYPAPPLPDSMSHSMQRMVHLGHFALYVVALVGLPLSGWLWSSVVNKPIIVLGLFDLSPLVGPAPEYAALVKLIHQLLSWSIGIVVLAHVAIALKHHIVDKNSVLTHMLPSRSLRK